MLHKYTFIETLCLISVFSLFSIVTFPNGGCASQDASRNGTCYTSEECLDKSGTVSGNCASGYKNLNIIMFFDLWEINFTLESAKSWVSFKKKYGICRAIQAKPCDM